MIRVAQIISVIFHPVFMPIFLFIILFSFDNYLSWFLSFKGKLLFLSFISVTTLLLPGAIVLLLIYKKYLKTTELNNKDDRSLPYMVFTIFYYLNYYLFSQLKLPHFFNHLFLGGCILLLLLFIINFYWKISAHMAGIGGIFGSIYAASSYNFVFINLLFIVLVISGIVGSARLILDAHDRKQIYGGFGLGALVMWLSLKLL